MRCSVPPEGEEGLSNESLDDGDEKESFLFDFGLDIDLRIWFRKLVLILFRLL